MILFVYLFAGISLVYLKQSTRYVPESPKSNRPESQETTHRQLFWREFMQDESLVIDG